jgi:hypothetical protein
MKKFFLVALIFTFFCSLSFAAIRRVGFFGPFVANVDYQTLQAAHDAANAGDTIMIMPGAYVSVNISKQLVIIGPGYLLDASGNTGLQANTTSTNPGNGIQFDAGSSNTQVIGCQIGYTHLEGADLTGILFKRCLFTNAILFNANASNLTFQQCIIEGQVHARSYGVITVNNLSFLNSIFFGYISDYSGINSGFIYNCIFCTNNASNDFRGGTWLIQNCVSDNSIFSAGNSTFYNNISTNSVGLANQFPAGNGNQQNKVWTSIFNFTGSSDGQFTLKAGSPAIGAGLNGTTATDCGIFGGSFPYRLSGIPPVPTIYALSSPQGTLPAGNTVQVTLSTRTNN